MGAFLRACAMAGETVACPRVFCGAPRLRGGIVGAGCAEAQKNADRHLGSAVGVVRCGWCSSPWIHASSHALLRLQTPQTAVKAAIDKWEEANGEDPAEAKKVRQPAGPLLSAGASRE